MTKSLFRPVALSVLWVGALAVSGCANRPQPLYEWGGYQAQVYEYFKGQSKSPQDQLLVLEEDLQGITANGHTPPPGYHAHMALLYATVGKGDQAMKSFQAEKALFPESAKYIDFLVSKTKKVSGGQP
jgi:hypothetical protein